MEDGFNQRGWVRSNTRVGRRSKLDGKQKPPKQIDPEKEWEKVKLAWRGDRKAWERYSGFSLQPKG